MRAIVIEEWSKAAVRIETPSGQTTCNCLRLTPNGQSNGSLAEFSGVKTCSQEACCTEEPAFLPEFSHETCLILCHGILLLNRKNEARRTGAVALNHAVKLLA
jgi:hypothetical protein